MPFLQFSVSKVLIMTLRNVGCTILVLPDPREAENRAKWLLALLAYKPTCSYTDEVGSGGSSLTSKSV